jgi:hemolysin III
MRIAMTRSHSPRATVPTAGAAPSGYIKPVMRGWLHVGSFFTVLVLGLLLLALNDASRRHRLTLVVYLLGTLTMFGTSALYHRGRWTEQQLRTWRRLDHSTIFLAIAGAYTPVAVVGLDESARRIILIICWTGAILGIGLQWVRVAPPRAVFTAVYIIVGWSVVPFVAQLHARLGTLGLALIVAGGVAYTLGAVVYAMKRPDPWPTVFGYHEVFHLMTVVGAGLHLATIAFVVVPRM